MISRFFNNFDRGFSTDLNLPRGGRRMVQYKKVIGFPLYPAFAG
jgi:hypothetical protein